MKEICLILVFAATLLVACSETYTTSVGGFCETATDCTCPASYEADCESDQCLCLKTDTVETGCETDADCSCAESYDAVCQEGGMCYCQELNQECYPLARGEFTHQLMGKLIDLDSYVPTGQTFSDVPLDHEYYAAIEAAVEYGFIDGDSNGNFRPEDYLNRAEGSKFVIMVINGLESYTPPDSPTYFDVPVDAWYFDYVEAATQLKLTKGYVNQDGSPTGYFGPGDVASSCFMDAMMARAEFPIQCDSDIQIIVSFGAQLPPAFADKGTTVDMFHYSIVSTADVVAKGTFLRVEIYNPQGNPVLSPVDSDSLGWIKLIHTSTQNTMAGPAIMSGAWGSGTNLLYRERYFSEDYDIQQGQALNLIVRLDLGPQLPSGYQVRVGVKYVPEMSLNSEFQDMVTGNYVPMCAVTGASETWLFGEWVTIN